MNNECDITSTCNKCFVSQFLFVSLFDYYEVINMLFKLSVSSWLLCELKYILNAIHKTKNNNFLYKYILYLFQNSTLILIRGIPYPQKVMRNDIIIFYSNGDACQLLKVIGMIISSLLMLGVFFNVLCFCF